MEDTAIKPVELDVRPTEETPKASVEEVINSEPADELGETQKAAEPQPGHKSATSLFQIIGQTSKKSLSSICHS
jgi:hypothetical protein